MPSTTFYVYVLCRPNGSPFYVGKGKGRRIYGHELEARQGVRSHKCNIIRAIWREGGQVHRNLLLRTTDEAQAFQWEREIVAAIGLDLLSNQTDGGEGPAQRALWEHPAYAHTVTPDIEPLSEELDRLSLIEDLMPDPFQ